MILHTSRTFFNFFPPSGARPSETAPSLPTSGTSRISIMLTAGHILQSLRHRVTFLSPSIFGSRPSVPP